MVRKTLFCVKMSVIFRKNLGAGYLICKPLWCFTCGLWNEDLSLSFLAHGKLMVRVFG